MDKLKDTSILGVQIGITSGCAVYYNGEIVFAASEERFSKVKNETLFPELAIQNAFEYCEKKSIPIPTKAIVPSYNMDFGHYLLRRECTFSIEDYIKEQKEYYYPRLYQEQNANYADIFKEKIDTSLSEKLQAKYGLINTKEDWLQARIKMVQELTGIKDIQNVNHEHSHAAYGAYVKNDNLANTLIVCIDGFGDDANCSIWIYENNKLRCLKKYRDFNIGRLYRYMTLLLGMKPNEHEYKVMGLAPYASEYTVNKTYPIFENTAFIGEDGEIKYKNKPQDHYFYFKDRLEGHRFDGIAGALQKYAEKMITDIVSFWMKKESKSRLVISGGVALNIKANMELSKLAVVKQMFVPASAGDESHAISSIYAFLDESGSANDILPIQNMYLGNEYSQIEMDEKINAFLTVNKDYSPIQNISNKVIARLLSEKFIIGRFVGRMEFGARSLGNRAILADPRKNDIIRIINSKIKSRDFWMPFTPSILDFKAKDYLVNPKQIDFPFMTIACETTAEAKENIIASLHPADFTSRPQIVTEQSNVGYYDLINEFYKLTGVGALLNTSLNLHGLPICESPEDVFNVLKNSSLDMALLGTTLLFRKGKDIEKYL